MSSSGVVSIRFDVQGNEQLLSILKASSVGIKGFSVEMTGLQQTLAKPMGGQGPLQNMIAGTEQATTKVAGFRTQLASIGSQLGANATSFGVATASIWGVYNAYDSLEKVQIRAHASAVKVQTLETSLASLTERRRIAVEKGNLTAEQMAILNEKIANTTEKLSVAQERNADVTQDLQEAWVGFFSTVGPQVVAAGGSIAQLFTTLTTKSPAGVSALGQLKTAFTGLISSIGSAGGGAVAGISNVFSKLTSGITGTTKAVGPLDNAMKGATTGTGFLSSGLGAVTIGLGAAALGAVGIIELVGHMQQVMTDAGLKFRESKFGLLDIKNMQFSADQFDAIAKKFEEHGEKISILQASMFPAETLAKFKEWGGQINSITGEIEPLGASISGLGEGFTATREDFTGWATDLLRGGQQANQVFLWLINSHIKDSDALQILSDATANYKQELLDLGLTTAQYNAVADGANVIIGKYIDRVATGQVPLDSLTESIHKQVTAFAVNNDLTDDQAKAMEKLVLAQLKARVATVAHTAEIDKERDARYAANEATIQSFVAYNGVNALQGKSIGQMEVFNDTIGKSIDGIVEQELNLRKWADAEAMATQTTVDFVNAQFDSIDSMINVNKINDGGIDSLIKLRQAHTDGLTAAQTFYTNMVTGAITTETATKAIADNAKTVGIQADMMAFSASKAQELITTTYDMNRAFSDQAVAAATDVTWLQDKVLIDAQLKQGMIDGATSANAWTIEMIKSTQAAKDEHGQLVALAETMGITLPDGIQLTTDQLHTLMTAFKETGSSAFELDKIMNEKLQPSFQHFGDIFSATSWKEFKSSWKDLQKSGGLQGIPKDLRNSLKDIGSDLIDINKHAKEATNVIDALLVSAASDRQKGTKSGLKALLEDVKDIPGNDKIGPFKTAIAELIALPKSERTKALIDYTDAFAAYKDAIKPDSPGGTIITSGEADNINKLTKAAKDGRDPVTQLAASFNTLSTSSNSLTSSLQSLSDIHFDPSKSITPLTNLQLGGAVSGEAEKIFNQPKTTAITPPAPLVFPPPDMHNITDAIAKIEVDIGSMVDFAANLVLTLPPMNIDAINEGLTTAEENLGSIIDFGAGLVVAFPAPNIEALNSGLTTAEQNLGSIIDFVAGLVIVFPAPNIVAVANQTAAASKAAATLVTDVAALKPVFPGVNIVGIVNSTSSAKKAAATIVPDIKALKPAFPGVNIIGVVNSTTNAKNAASKLEGHVAGLHLAFPKINIDNITSSVNAAQNKINSLKGTTVTNHVKTVFDNAGGNILNDIKLMSAATGKLFTTNGEQLFRVGDNPGGRETVAMIPHDKPGPIIEKLNQMFPNVYSTLHQRARKQAMQSVSNGMGGGMQRSGPTVVNVTTEVYLFPGSDMFKKFVKSIMLEEMSRYAAV